MIRSQHNVAMQPSAVRAIPADAMNLLNYLTMNAYAPLPSRNNFIPGQNHIVHNSTNFNPGMKEVLPWLKSLRLHKYSDIFFNLTYEQMLCLDEGTLERHGVTKGARGKLLQHIAKLKRRPFIIREMITQLDAGKDPACRCPIIHLRNYMSTPIREYAARLGETQEKIEGNVNVDQISDNNLPALLVLLLQKVQHFIISCRQGEVSDEYCLMLFKTHDLILANEAFTENQKRRVTHMKKQAKKYVSPGDLRRKATSTNAGGCYNGKCEYCQEIDARIGPMPLHDILPPPPVYPRAPKKEKKKEQRRHAKSKHLPDLEIGEWNPNYLAANIAAIKFNEMNNYIRYLEKQNLLRTDEQQKAMIQFTQSCLPDLMSLPQVPPPHLAARMKLEQNNVLRAGVWNNNMAKEVMSEQKERDPRILPTRAETFKAIPSTSRTEPILSQPAVDRTDSTFSSASSHPTVSQSPPMSRPDIPGINYIPQYRSGTNPAAPTSPAPIGTKKKETETPELTWPTSLYNSDIFSAATSDISNLPDFSTFHMKEPTTLTPASNSWFNLLNQQGSGDSTSGYSSSASERGSGAGSPRTHQEENQESLMENRTPLDLANGKTWDLWKEMIQSWQPVCCSHT